MSAAVAITGSGAICAAGGTPERIFETLCAGTGVFSPVRRWDCSNWPAPLAGHAASVDAAALFADRKLLKSLQRLRPTDLFGLYAASEAVKASGLIGYRDKLEEAGQQLVNERTAVHVGSGGVSYHYQYDFLPTMAGAGGDLQSFAQNLGASVNPTWLLQALPNNVLCYLGIAYGFKGPNSCITNHSVSATLAIIEAMHALRAGDADRAVAAGNDSPIDPEITLNLYQLGLLTADRIRPFDIKRSGCLLGEGAAAMVLETRESADARGAPVLGTVLGAGVTAEAGGVLGIRADGDGLARAIALALEDAALDPAQVGLIVAHGNGTANSDPSEAAAIRAVFGADAPPVTAFKWCFGHLMAAAGIIDAVLALNCLRAKLAPGIATLRAPDPRCMPLPVSAAAATPRSDVAIVLGRGFAGMSTALVIQAAPGATA